MTRKTVAVTRKTSGARALVSQALEGLDDLGLDDALPDVREAYARLQELAGALRRAPTDYLSDRGPGEEALSALADQVVDGSVDVAKAVEQLATARARADISESASELLARAAENAALRARRALVTPPDRLVREVLAPTAATIVEETATIAAKLPPDVVDDATAVQAGAKVRTSWQRLLVLGAHWTAIQHFAETMRGAGVTSSAGGGSHALRHPDRLRVHPEGRLAHPALRLAHAIADGAEPGVFTADEVPVPPALARARSEREAARRRMAARLQSQDDKRLERVKEQEARAHAEYLRRVG